MSLSSMLAQRAADELSFTSQLRSSWPLVILGVAGFTAGIFLTIWNEAHAVAATKALEDAMLTITPISDSRFRENSLEGKLVYLTGYLSVQEPLTEVEYGVSVMAVKLKRRVQMYQWVEGQIDQLDDDGNMAPGDYYYYREWKDKLIDSNQFETTMSHWNPREFPLKSQVQINEKATVGAFELCTELKERFNTFVEIASDERPERKDIKLHSGLYYHSMDVWNPEVGDIRVQMSYAGHQGEMVTVVALMGPNGLLLPHTSQSGIGLMFLRVGTYSLEDIFALEKGESRLMMWFYRGAAWAVMYLSCICLSNLNRAVLHRFRFLRQIAPGSTSLSMTISMISSLLITSLSWMWYRPYLGGTLIVMSILFLLCSRCYQDPSPRYRRL